MTITKQEGRRFDVGHSTLPSSFSGGTADFDSRWCSAAEPSEGSKGGPAADGERYPESATWSADGEFTRAAYTLCKDDDDFGQAGILVRDVMDDPQRERRVSNVVGHLRAGVSQPVLQRAFEYWSNIDKSIGDRIRKGVTGG